MLLNPDTTYHTADSRAVVTHSRSNANKTDWFRTLLISVTQRTNTDVEQRTATMTDKGHWTTHVGKADTVADRPYQQALSETLFPQLAPQLRLIGGNGLSVHSLENIVADLETKTRRFLRDYSELEASALTHECKQKKEAVDVAQKWVKEREKKVREEERVIQEIIDRETEE